jgi:hypothetical protein
VLMARRKEIVGRADHFQDEITGRPGLASCHRTIAEHALTVLVDSDLFLDLISVHDSHGVPPVFLWSGGDLAGGGKPNVQAFLTQRPLRSTQA